MAIFHCHLGLEVTMLANRSCDRCYGAMVLRTAHRGPSAGQQFFGCSNYPRCKRTRPLPSNAAALSQSSTTATEVRRRAAGETRSIQEPTLPVLRQMAPCGAGYWGVRLACSCGVVVSGGVLSESSIKDLLVYVLLIHSGPTHKLSHNIASLQQPMEPALTRLEVRHQLHASQANQRIRAGGFTSCFVCEAAAPNVAGAKCPECGTPQHAGLVLNWAAPRSESSP
jgi:ssDNA-binding Zn-finger/Zn-ribbon topoisomerase 1